MSEARVGRLLVASLHQAIADVLPTRLEFYENWLNVSGMREGTIGLGPLFAVLSFLRAEGRTYDTIVRRAGDYAGEWTVRELPALERRLISAMPQALRTRGALRTARNMVRATYPGTRSIIKGKGSGATIDLRGSLFCEVRELSPSPLCGFYAAAVRRVLREFSLPSEVDVLECRASGVRRACVLNVAAAASGTGTDVPVGVGPAEKL